MRSSSDVIEVFACPGYSPEDEAKLQIQAAAEVLTQRAANLHAEGMADLRAAVKLEMTADIAEGESIIAIRDRLVSDGVIEILPSLNTYGGEA